MRSSDCTKSSNDESRRRPCCHPPKPPPCCSGHCSPPVRSTCERSMAGRPSPQHPSLSQLTSQPDTIPSCYRRSRHTEFPTTFRAAPDRKLGQPRPSLATLRLKDREALVAEMPV